MPIGNVAAANEAQIDPLGEDIHLEDWSPRNVNSQIPLSMHVPMSSSPNGVYTQPQRQHTQSLTTGLLEEMSKIRFEIGRVASAIESKIRMDDPLWDQCADAIEAMTELDDEAKLIVMEILADGMEMRKMFIRLKDSQRRSWILRKIGRTGL
ncbi:hypothetical protein AQUCO_05300073v1 [Aquilegia coerulea]|uniref:Uncharacterized protein n=1 Tax=Aquilegia coerulea TaxID=218851 RepID=A0A2G5CI70_AQUCA|nr:hypothetical protein AQUCO_05300073v1 [Aquilegia coerulea]